MIGAVLPLSQYLPWTLEDWGNMGFFLQEARTTPAARGVLADLLWAAVFFVLVSVRVWQIRTWLLMLAVLTTWTLGLSCGLPLYFALRDPRL